MTQPVDFNDRLPCSADAANLLSSSASPLIHIHPHLGPLPPSLILEAYLVLLQEQRGHHHAAEPFATFHPTTFYDTLHAAEHRTEPFLSLGPLTSFFSAASSSSSSLLSLPTLQVWKDGSEDEEEKNVISGVFACVDWIRSRMRLSQEGEEEEEETSLVFLQLQLRDLLAMRLLPALDEFLKQMTDPRNQKKTMKEVSPVTMIAPFQRLIESLDLLEVKFCQKLRQRQASSRSSSVSLMVLIRCLLTPVLLFLRDHLFINFRKFRLMQLESFLNHQLRPPPTGADADADPDPLASFFVKLSRRIDRNVRNGIVPVPKVTMLQFQEQILLGGHCREEIGTEVIVPKSYTVHLTPRPREYVIEDEGGQAVDFSFAGSVEMIFETKCPTREIVLNVNDISILSAVLRIGGHNQSSAESLIRPIATLMNRRLQRVTFVFDRVIPAGVADARLVVDFEGKLQEKLTGLYRSKYGSKFMLVTQFEATGARMAFPCVDEPAAKASFELLLTLPVGITAISNMPVLSDEPSSVEIMENVKEHTEHTVHFEPSVKMSTYLLAICVMDENDFGFVEGRTKKKKKKSGSEEEEGEEEGEGVLIRVWSRAPEEGAFALECIVKALPLFEDFFNQPFPLPKCDLIAVSEFAFGAMENWGLMIFRETAMLLSSNSAAHMRSRVATMVVHELAHQWFGNLVTMKWWDDLWLNEGFAMWCQYYFVDQIFPDLKAWQLYVTNDFASALSLDCLQSSHPIEVPVTKPSQIDEIFDSISYEKGCAVVRTVVQFVGLSNFQNGVQSYLAEFKYGNATTNDLWRNLSDASGMDVQSLLAPWTRTTGFPYLDVTQPKGGSGGGGGEEEGEEEEGHFEVKRLTLRQRRWGRSAHPCAGRLWPIPLTYTTNEGTVFQVLMDKESITLEMPPGTKWVKINPGCTSFCRVLYGDESLLGALQKNMSSLSEIDRLHVLTDVKSMIQGHALPSKVCFSFLEGLREEEEYAVLKGMNSYFVMIRGLVKYDEDPFLRFNKFAQGILSHLKNKYATWETASDDTSMRLLQTLVVQMLVSVDDPSIIAEAEALFEADPSLSKVSPDLKADCMQVIVRNGGQEAYDAVLRLYRQAESNEDGLRCLRALGKTKIPALQQAALDFMYTDAVKVQDKLHLFASVCLNSTAREVFWADFVKQWSEIQRLYHGSLLFPYFVDYACGVWSTNEMAQMVTKFFEDNPCPALERRIAQAIESCRCRARFLLRERGPIVEWLQQNVRLSTDVEEEEEKEEEGEAKTEDKSKVVL